MFLLAASCVTVAVVPSQVVGLFSKPLEQLLGPDAAVVWAYTEYEKAPTDTVGWVNAWVLIVGAVGTAGFLRLTRGRSTAEPTWGCGYARPTARMQYTGRSFAEMLAEHLLPRSLRPRTRRHHPEGLFPTTGQFSADSSDPVTRRVYEPFFRRWADRFGDAGAHPIQRCNRARSSSAPIIRRTETRFARFV
jgi:hypothetical protein